MKNSVFLSALITLIATPLIASAASKKSNTSETMDLRDASSISCVSATVKALGVFSGGIDRITFYNLKSQKPMFYRTQPHEMENLKITPWSLSFDYIVSKLKTHVSLKVKKSSGRPVTEDSGMQPQAIYAYKATIDASNFICNVNFEGQSTK